MHKTLSNVRHPSYIGSQKLTTRIKQLNSQHIVTRKILTPDAFLFQELDMSDMEKEEAVKKPPSIVISPAFLYGVTAGVKVLLMHSYMFCCHNAISPAFHYGVM